MKVLFINACVRKESRTKVLADYVLRKIGGDVVEVNLNEKRPEPLNLETLNQRSQLIRQGAFDDKMFLYAKEFASADIIVMAAPFWDFSFPALLKTYIEHVNVSGIVFKYSDQGIQGLCRAQKLYYITTMGGYNTTDFGYGYVKALCNELYQIKDVRLIKAEGLDIVGNDIAGILEAARKNIDNMF
ncbi:MAG: NAD(P)H-dependent oxidoreductase [Alphaproteobacteria bacterium]|nr:NAD(P)H-dependent oxidoreductase [Alphaproteobacteria bacterium]